MMIYRKSITLCLMAVSCVCHGREYRVDSQEEFDRISAVQMRPGDSVLLKRGVTFTGMLAPKGNGAEGQPVRVTAYGDGQRPVIQAQGQHTAGLLLKDPSYWEIEGLEITNTNGTDEDQGDLFGIYVLADGKEGVHRHVYISDCY
ncbi:MAG: hypothetical protein GY809_07380, partial [Planctomycetes bacterium]|nr:hypothetical protein [Planctomycetota bacterium]